MARRRASKDDLVLAPFLNNPDYLAYPARLEHEHTFIKDRKTGEKDIRLNRVTAKTICEKFEKIGILTHTMAATHRRRDNSRYYHANESRDGFVSYCRWRHENREEYLNWLLLGNGYSRLVLNRQFVVDTLREKGIVFKMPEMAFPPRPGEDLTRTGVVTPSRERVWSLPVLGRYPKRFESEEEIDRAVSDPCFPSFTPPNIAGKKGYTDADDISRYREKIRKMPKSYYPLRMENEESKIEISEDDFNTIKQINPGKFDDEYNRLVLQGYYENYQEEFIILPILGLIRNSPSALFEFLFSDWTEDNHGVVHSGSLIEPIEAVLFRMVFKTIGDILNNDSAFDYEDSMGEHAYFGTTQMDGKEINSLLTLKLRDGRKIVYEGGFTTNFTWIALNDADVVPLITNKENSRIKTKVIGERYKPVEWFYPPKDDENIGER